MTDENRSYLRHAIVEALEKARDESSFSDLLARLGKVNQTSVKAVIWQLIADGEIELTPRRALRVPEKHRHNFTLAR
jgi:hypothetical protein